MCRCRSCFKLGDGAGREDARRRQRALAEAESRRSTPEEYAEFYGHRRRPVRRAGADHPLPRRGPERILGAPLRPVDEALRPVRSGRARAASSSMSAASSSPTRPRSCRPGSASSAASIDSEDLPLNISREMLQKNPMLEAIGKAVTNRILADLEKLAGDDKERFEKIWEAFGAGDQGRPLRGRRAARRALQDRPLPDDHRRRRPGGASPTTSPRCGRTRPRSTTRSARTRTAILASPQLEGFARRGIEVLLLSDPVDAFWVRTALGYDGKPFQSVTQGAADLDKIPLAEGEPRRRGGAGERGRDARRALQADARRQGERGPRLARG